MTSIVKPTITDRQIRCTLEKWGMRGSPDLRHRVVDFVRSSGSKAEAARRFRVGEASVYRWLKPGGLAYKRPDPQRPHKLDWEQFRRQVEDPPDRTQAERARPFQVSRHCLWHALRKLAVTHKKKDGRPRPRPAPTKRVPPASRTVSATRQTARLHR
ncbi:MAG: IS630 transposase-related protein [Nitrospira sp.]